MRLLRVLSQNFAHAVGAIGIMMACSLSQARVSTPVDYAVSESGAATLSIVIEVPRGIGGMEPQLALNYSSAAGNGLLGLGWVLTGPSTISRCPTDVINDGVKGSVNFDANDRFCLDGQRLLIVEGAAYGADGASYRTIPESFSRITSLGRYIGSNGAAQPNVPTSFKVETKAGLIMEFGLDTNSRIRTNFSPIQPQTISRWMLQRISDRTANKSFVEFIYCSGAVSADGATCNESAFAGSAVLHYIRYTNRNNALNGENAVVFRYEDRPDAVLTYRAGSATTQTQRLKAIETYVNFSSLANRGYLVKGYDLNYESLTDRSGNPIRVTPTSRLQSVVERDNAGTTLPPVIFWMANDTVFGPQYWMQSTGVRTISSGTEGTSNANQGCGGVIGTRLSLLCR